MRSSFAVSREVQPPDVLGRLAAITLSAVLCLLLSAGTARAADMTVPVIQIPFEGSDRLGTAVAISQGTFESASSVIIATGYNFPDALGGSALAGALRCPLLLTASNGLSPVVTAEIRRLRPAKAYILGSEGAVGANVADELAGLVGGAGNVKRLGGRDRYETAALVAVETVQALEAAGRPYDGAFFIATGENFPDALAASPLAVHEGWPILLSRQNALPDSTRNALTGIHASSGFLLGSTAALSDNVAANVKATVGYEPTRLGGKNRYETAIGIVALGYDAGIGYDGIAFATGTNYPDALAGGVMQGLSGSAMLLTPSDSLDPSVAAKLSQHDTEIVAVRFFGSRIAITEGVRTAIANRLRPALAPSPTTPPSTGSGTCEITIKTLRVNIPNSGYSMGQMYATNVEFLALTPSGQTIAQGPTDYTADYPFTGVPQDSYAVAAVQELAQLLKNQGWTQTGVGAKWYNLRFSK